MTLSRPLVTLTVAWSLWARHAEAYRSLPDDLFAYPKYTIGFLNGLPLPNVTAQYWLAHGLEGGEKEFLEQPWDQNFHGTSRPQITGGETINSDGPVASHPVAHRLEHMRLGPEKEYLCLVSPPEQGNPSIEDQTPPHSHPSKTWNLLQPLSGKCLYHRQGWFTYSYCHNDHVRQFREMSHGHPHPIQGRIPEEDTEWEAYNLGVSPAAKQKRGSDVSRQAEAAAANLELQRAADQLYLVQRWGDGTQCDKTGRKREIEVQFHCSMSSVDQIMFVKEVSVCNYLIVIHTPRICSEPGFKSHQDNLKAAPIRCRQIVPKDAVDFDRAQIESLVPLSLPPPARPILIAALSSKAQPREKRPAGGAGKRSSPLGEDEKQAEFVKVALGALFDTHVHDRALAGKKIRIEHDGGVHEVDFTDVGVEAVEQGQVPDMNALQKRLSHILQAAGYDVVTDEWPEERGNKGKGEKEKEQEQNQKHQHQDL